MPPDDKSVTTLLQRLPRVISILQVQMPVVRRRRLRNQPSLIQRINNLLRQRALLNILQIALELRLARNTNNNTIITAILDVQVRVVEHPSESRLEQRQVVLFDDGLDDSQGLESGVLEVALAVGAAARAFGVAEAAALGHVGGFVFAAEEAAGDGVVDYDVEAVAAAGGDQFGFDAAGDGVVLER
jgi:hypothetical protein